MRELPDRGATLKGLLRIAALLAMAVASACGGGGGSSSSGDFVPTGRGTPPPTPPPRELRELIKHVVIVVQENRSFDNLFRGFPKSASPQTTATCTTVRG